MLKQKLAKFMYGRYGVDELGNFLSVTYLVLAILGIISGIFSSVLYIVLFTLSVCTLVWWTVRVFSRNTGKRRVENAKYLGVKNKVVKFFTLQKNKVKYRKTHRYRKCPKCKNNLRLPYVKGEHRVKCPKCGTGFDVKL